jgi:hypothetical protein
MECEVAVRSHGNMKRDANSKSTLGSAQTKENGQSKHNHVVFALLSHRALFFSSVHCQLPFPHFGGFTNFGFFLFVLIVSPLRVKISFQVVDVV